MRNGAKPSAICSIAKTGSDRRHYPFSVSA
jgi:hypothetical protein